MNSWIINKYRSLIVLIRKNDLCFAIFIVSIVVIAGLSFGWYNNKAVPINPDPGAHYLLEKNPLSFTSNWDGPNYLSIARFSYNDPGQTNFFPLYPILIHLLNYLIPSLLISALIITWISLIGAVYFFIKIIKYLFKEKYAINTLPYLIFFILFPTAVFLLGTYTESLMAFLSLAAIYYALTKRYDLVAIFAVLVAITNLDGLLVLLLLAVIMLEQRASLLKVAIFSIFSLTGLATYGYYLKVRFNNFWLFITSQKSHGWLNRNYSELISGIDPFNIIFVVLILASAYYWFKNNRPSFAIYSLSFLLVPILGNQFGGFNRYALMIFPISIMAYPILKKHPSLLSGMIVLSVISWTYFALQYFGGYVGG